MIFLNIILMNDIIFNKIFNILYMEKRRHSLYQLVTYKIHLELLKVKYLNDYLSFK